MNVILLEKIKTLGQVGDEVTVRPGFGRNFLIPQGKAVPANAANREYFESRRADLEKAAAEKLAEAEKRAEKLNGLKVNLTARAADEGKLYGSVGAAEIAEIVEKAGQEVNKSEIQLPDGPFRTVGEYEVAVHLHHGEVVATINLSIIPEE